MAFISKLEPDPISVDPFDWQRDVLSEDELLAGCGVSYLVPGVLTEGGLTVAWGYMQAETETAARP